MVIGQTYSRVCTKNEAIDPFFSYIGTTYSHILKNVAIGFFFPPGIYKFLLHPNITYKFLLYTSSQHHNSLLSQLLVTSQHYIQFPTSQIPTTNLEQQVPNTKLPKDIYIYIYKFCTSQKIYKKNFFTFKTALK